MGDDDNIGGLVPPREFDRRGVDAALLAVTKTLVGEVEKRAIAEEDSHRREHEDMEKHRLERLANQERFMSERDKRYEERFLASQQALQEASASAKEAIAVANANAKEAITVAFANAKEAIATANASQAAAILKSENAQAEVNKATFVTIDNLRQTMAGVMPRAEADNRFNEIVKTMDELKLQQRTMLAQRQGNTEAVRTRTEDSRTQVAWIAAAISFVVMIVVVANAFFGR